MPKVTEEYIINKKKMITDAAYELCLEKTVSTVTMQDIINRTGLSQGGIYRFYRDIDEIFGDMLADMRKKVTIKEQVDEILGQADELPAAEVTYRICDMLAEHMEAELMGIQKIDFEMSILAMNAPERVDKILTKAQGMGNKEYLMRRMSEFYKKKLDSGELHAKVNEIELLSFISSAYTGIQSCCIVYNCYNKSPFTPAYQPRIQFKVLAKTINYLLGIEK
ncbi:MAG: TetR/AcrR family transcriptional regulator [Lachnospiraceae bacterium]|nr:TetR/AcrR family transcriptional regulator [Lachnospiraceae bacterium]